MKSSNTSKSARVIIVVGVFLIAGLIWLGLRSHKPAAPEAAPAVVENTPPPAPVFKPRVPPAKTDEVVQADNSSLAVIPVSLTNFLTSDAAYAGSAMDSMITGTQTLGGIEFWFQGIVRLQGTATRDHENAGFPISVVVPLDETNVVDGKLAVTERGRSIAAIYLVGGSMNTIGLSNEKIADVVWHYADGTVARSPIESNNHVRDWVRMAYEQPAQLPNPLTKVAWHGPHPKRKNITLRAYRVAFVNPHPEKTIHTLEFASTLARASLFISALTLDPLAPGARPDNLTSEEMADPELNGQLQLYVTDSDGHALPDADIATEFSSPTAQSGSQKNRTDAGGMALVRFSDSGLQSLHITVNHDDFAERRVSWDVKGGDTVPTSYTMKLSADVKIGGIVYDSENNFIPGATVTLYRFWTGGENPDDKKGEQPSFNRQAVTADGEGRWQAKGLPAALLDHISFEVSHPDFIPKSYTVGDNATTEKQLRAGTHKTILQRGLDAHGRVVDSSDVPAAGVTVYAGQKYSYPQRKQTATDDKGQFYFHNLTEGDLLFAVMAKGHSPDSRTVNVKANMDEIVFRLTAGNVIRGHVQDESGQPVAGAAVTLNGQYGQPSYDFSTVTDSNGDFSWDSAPDQAMPFDISKDGFESKSNLKLSPNQDNTITLHAPRTLQGLVLDDSTGQPVTKFSVRTGNTGPDASYLNGIIQYKNFAPADGKFTVNVTQESDNAVGVYADDYADAIEKFPDAQDGTVSVTIRMKPSASLSGVVLTPEGTPAPGVSVGVASEKPRTQIQLSVGRLGGFDPQNKIVVTDAEGHFKVAVPSEDGTVLAAGDAGFASLPVAAVRSSGTVPLQAWGRIEGTLSIGGQPGVGKDVMFNLKVGGANSDFNGYKATTDDQGKFTIEKVPPGDGEIVRLIKTAPTSWTWSDRTAVTIKSGETTQVALGDHGAVIVGTYHYDAPPTNSSSLVFQGSLSMAMPQHPAFNSPDDARAYYISPEWKAQMKLRKNYTLEMKSDGSFDTDDVAPGTYTLNVSVRVGGQQMWQNQPLAQGSVPITVPDSFDPATPINVGEVTLQPVTPQSH